jgi:hypothetical protein
MRRAAFATALVTVLGMAAWLAPAVSAAPTALMGCSARGSGSPGITTFTLHMSNSCGFPTRAVRAGSVAGAGPALGVRGVALRQQLGQRRQLWRRHPGAAAVGI